MIGDLVTPGGVLVMDADTMANHRRAWLAARRWKDGVGWCLGSSEMAMILGVPYCGTPAKLWAIKVKGAEQPDNRSMFWGRMHEDTIARVWRDQNRSVVEPIGLVASEAQPWHQTSLDREVLECPLNRDVRRRCALEIKHRGAFGSRRFHAELPDDVLAQLCHQIFVTGFDHIHYAILIGGDDYHQGVVYADDVADVITYVIGKANVFREMYLTAGAEVEPPWEVDGRSADSLLELDAMLHPTRVGELSVADVGEVIELAELRAAEGAAKRRVKEQMVRVARLANGARFLTMDDEFGTPQLVCSYDERHRTKVDVDTLAERYPAAYADPDVVTQTTGYQLTIANAYKPSTRPEE